MAADDDRGSQRGYGGSPNSGTSSSGSGTTSNNGSNSPGGYGSPGGVSSGSSGGGYSSSSASSSGYGGSQGGVGSSRGAPGGGGTSTAGSGFGSSGGGSIGSSRGDSPSEGGGRFGGTGLGSVSGSISDGRGSQRSFGGSPNVGTPTGFSVTGMRSESTQAAIASAAQARSTAMASQARAAENQSMINYTAAREALLDTINWAEGNPSANTLFGYDTFDDLSVHPNTKVPYGDTFSTAAGTYQINEPTWNDYASKVGVTDFSEESQKAVAMAIAEDRYAKATGKNLDVALAQGDIVGIARALGPTWASLPSGPLSNRAEP